MLQEDAAFMDPEFEDMEAMELPNEGSDQGFCLSRLTLSAASDPLNENPYLFQRMRKSNSTSRIQRKQDIRKMRRQHSLPTLSDDASAHSASPSDFLHATAEELTISRNAMNSCQKVMAEMNHQRQFLLCKQEKEIHANVQKIETMGEEYLEGYGKSMSDGMKAAFIDDFTTCIENTKEEIKQNYEKKMKQVQTIQKQKLNEAMGILKKKIDKAFQRQLKKFKQKLASSKLEKLTEMRENMQKRKQLELTTITQRHAAKSNGDLLRYENLLNQHMQQSIRQLKMELDEKLSRKKEEVWRNIAGKQDDMISQIEEEFENKIQECKSRAYDQFQQQVAEFRNRTEESLKQKRLDTARDLESKLQQTLMQQKKQIAKISEELEETEKQRRQSEHDEEMKALTKELQMREARIRQNSDRAFQNQRRTLEIKRTAALKELEEDCILQFEKRIIDLKAKIRTEYEEQQTAIISKITKEEKKRHEIELNRLRQELNEETRASIEDLRHKLKSAMKKEAKKEREAFTQKKEATTLEIRTVYAKEREIWMQKITGAAELDQQQTLSQLREQLQKERDESIRSLKMKIQKQKLEKVQMIKHEFERVKREKLMQIRDQYLNNPNFPEDRVLLQLKSEMEEELSLLDRFKAFSRRIHDLEEEVLHLRNQVNV